MRKAIQSEVVRSALQKHGWNQSELAEMLGVSAQSVTNWLSGEGFPRPATLLKLATTLKLTFEQLVESGNGSRPIVAFRKKGGAKTTDAHIAKAVEIGMLLKPLVPFLPQMQALRTLITSPSTDEQKLQVAVSQTRSKLGLGELAVLDYEHLIGEFKNCGAILVPVMWGKKKRHENALHIRLPEEDTTFIFLNLDTKIEDFKFWMAHELAHVYTPELAGTEDGEDFADAFAGALLFPKACAERAYQEAQSARADRKLGVLVKHAAHHAISLNTVFQQVKSYASSAKLPALPVSEQKMHAVRNSGNGTLISQALFDPMPPEPELYMAACEHGFQSGFFHALSRMIHEKGTGPSYLQQILDIPVQDAKALHEELSH